MALLRELNSKILVLDPESMALPQRLTGDPLDVFGNPIDLQNGYALGFALYKSGVFIDPGVTDRVSYRFQFSPDDDFGTPANIIECSPEAIMPRSKQPYNYLENPVGAYQEPIGIAGEAPARYLRVVLQVIFLSAAHDIVVTPIFEDTFSPAQNWTENKLPGDGKP